ncbi:IclR family transcriptional regulator [Haloparvum alkalitolerans]|uniref:IclR family transcriptional regulator n=1 Tax=Haloparvum alkalitolerans TaxID=1042953 RepID=UPI003CF9B3FF
MDDTVEAGDKLLRLVETLKEHGPSGVTELADRADMPKSTAHAYLSTLKEHGYVVQTDSRAYRLSLRFVDIGSKVRETRELYDEIRAKLDEISEETNEKAWWTVEENGKAVFMAKSAGKRAIQTNARIGLHLELYRLAAGMAILANLPAERRVDILDGYEYPLPDGRTRADLESELETVRETGVAYGTDSFLEGVTGIGVPLLDNAGTVHGAISVSGPSNRLEDDRNEQELTDLLRGISGELQVNFSYR